MKSTCGHPFKSHAVYPCDGVVGVRVVRAVVVASGVVADIGVVEVWEVGVVDVVSGVVVIEEVGVG